jgi:hypothetical protein
MSELEKQNQKQEDRIEALEKNQELILEMLKPIADTYRSVEMLGKWLMAFLVLVSVSIGIVLSWTKLFDK